MVLIIRNSYGCYSRISQCIKSHSKQTVCVRYCTRVKRPVLLFDEDRYNGVTANLQQLDINTIKTEDFSVQLADSLKIWKEENRTAAWLQVPITHSSLISIASSLGFQYHHAEGNKAMLKLWLQTYREDPTPLFATHQVGVSGFVLNEENNEVLVVQDKNRPYTLWKFPGGLSNLGEDIGDTAVREVFEETGIKCEFKSILSFRQQHQHPGAFGRSDFYVICRLKPLTFSINACSDEIRKCKWMHISDIKREVEASSLTKRLADMMEFGLANGFDKIDIHCEEMKSVYKGLKFKLYHRPFSLQKSTD